MADAQPPDPARNAVLARLTGVARRIGDRPLTLPSATLSPPPPGGLSAAFGQPSVGADPAAQGDRRVARAAIPAAALSGVTTLALIAVVVVMLVVGAGVATVVAAVLLAAATGALAAIAVHAGILARTDEQALDRWESARPWIGPLGTGPARALVGAACDAADRIAASTVWWSPALDDHRLTLDLAAELDQIDGQAYALAARSGLSAPESRRMIAAPVTGGAPVDLSDPEWSALVDHVAALVDYADRVERLSALLPGVAPLSVPAAGAPDPREGSAAQARAAGAARDEFATAQLRRLSVDLGSRAGP